MNTPPSMRGLNYELIWQWGLVIGLILFAAFMMIYIVDEKNTALDESEWKDFKGLIFPIPSWWTQTQNLANSWRFERTDTRYDWFCEIKKFPANSLNLEDILYQYLESEGIVFDPEIIIQTEPRFLFKDPDVADKFRQSIRIEGTATKKKIDRLYDDIYIFRESPEDPIYWAESRSSVLNGLVEGPFFEDAMSELKINPHKPQDQSNS